MISYKYNIYHSKKTKYLDKMLRECCFVWNHALAMLLQPVIYFGRAFPNWRVWVIPAVEIPGFHTFVSKNPICFSDGSVSINMYLTLAFVKEFGFKAGEAWSEITEYAYGCLSYSDFATTETLIPEGSEYLFNDVHTAEADELYHHVLDK